MQFRRLVHLDFPGQVGRHQVKASPQAVAGALDHLDGGGQTVVPGIPTGDPDRLSGNVKTDDPGHPQRRRGQADDPAAAADFHQARRRPRRQRLR